MDVLDEGASNRDQLLTPMGLTYLKQTYPWIRFLGVMGIIAGVMYMLMAFFAGSMFTMAGSQVNSPFAGFGAVIGIFYFVIGVFIAYIGYLLFGYGTKLKTGITINDAGQIERAFKDQKNYYLITGVLALIGLGFGVLGFLAAIFGGIAASTM